MVVGCVVQSGCRRGRWGRTYVPRTRTSQNSQPTKIPPFVLTAVPAVVLAALGDARTAWDELASKYGITGKPSDDPSVIDKLVEAWRDDGPIGRPPSDQMISALTVAFGDALVSKCGMKWTTIDGDVVGLCTPDGMLAVLPKSVAEVWVTGNEPVKVNDIIKQLNAIERKTMNEPLIYSGDAGEGK